MDTNILDTFRIVVDDIRDYHIIGIDPGAADWSAARADLSSGTLSHDKGIVDLVVLQDGVSRKDCSILFESGEIWHIGQAAALTAENARGEFFENFKLPPCSEDSKECYGNNLDNPTYRELMKHNFQCIIDRLFNFASNNLTGKKIVFFVGRPSSDDWRDSEVMYRDMLLDGLHVHGVDRENVQMAMVSEAQAALAAEVYKQRLDTNRITVIVDVGPSTTDVIVVKKGEMKTGEYSRQIGSGSIEANMLELAVYDDCNPAEIQDNMKPYFSGDSEYNNIVLRRRKLREAFKKKAYLDITDYKEFKFSKIFKFNQKIHDAAYSRFNLRMCKERYFGSEGNNGTESGSLKVIFEGERKVHLDIEKALMDKAIYSMPIYVLCSEHNNADNPYKGSYIYRSYYDAMAHFFDGVRDMFLTNEQPTQVILTGGASVMPFIKDLIHEKLGVEPSLSSHPSYTVSQGLAYIGYAEIKKREELGEINKLIDKVLDDNESDLRYDIKRSFVNWSVDRDMEEFSNWAENGYGVSLSSAISKSHSYDSQDIGEMMLVKKWWDDKIKSKIIEEIASRFCKLYKNASIQYNFTINPQIVGNAYIVGRTTNISLDIGIMLGGWTGFWIDGNKTDYTIDKRRKFFSKAKERRSELVNDICSQQSVIDLASAHAREILDGFKRELRTDVEQYVDGLTPYIIHQ